jgi:hypothetical protein
MRVFNAILTEGLGYLFQSGAFLINIQRWSVILEGYSGTGEDSRKIDTEIGANMMSSDETRKLDRLN